MAISLKIKTNSKQVSNKVKGFQSALSRAIDKGVKQAGFQVLDIIRTKTKKGIDFRDRKFAPYSQGYLKQLNREGKSTAVDLFYTGRMLGSLTPNSTVKSVGKHKSAQPPSELLQPQQNLDRMEPNRFGMQLEVLKRASTR